MKKLLFIVFTALVLAGCSKGRRVCCDLPEDNSIFMSATRADSVWRANFVETRLLHDSLYIFGTKGDEHIRIIIKPTSIGKYYVTPRNGTYYITVGGDVMGAEYPAAADTLNQVIITGYDQKKGLIQGDFNIRFVKSGRYAGTPYVNEALFSRGKFRAELPEPGMQ